MKERIHIIDTLRGLSVVLMVAHHFLYDAVEFLGAPAYFFSNPVFDVLHYIFAGCFIMLSGISSRFSKSNVKRSFKVLLAAAVITVVTYAIKMPIVFGILHFLGVCMLLYGLTGKWLQRFPTGPAVAVCCLGIIASAWLVDTVRLDVHFMWIFGFTYPGFVSYDYFPLLPWVFVFLTGTYLGGPIIAGKFPKWFYTANVPVFSSIGRHAFVVYILHQPVLYVLVMGIRLLLDTAAIA